jgi:hypothetical protein
MEKQNPFEDIGYHEKEVPKELKGIVVRKVETLKLLMELSQQYDQTVKAAMSSLFKTEVDL